MTHKSSAKFYDRLSRLYPLIDLFLKPQKRKFIAKINSYPYGRLLEIGVGNGSHLKYYSTHEITCIDNSASMLSLAKKHCRDNMQLLQMNGEVLSFRNETFDYVVLSHVIAVVEDPEKLLEETHRVLKPQGKVFILNHFTPDNGLKYIDRSVEGISRLLCFKSVFQIADLKKIKTFTLLKEFNAGMFSYFKVLIYEKHL